MNVTSIDDFFLKFSLNTVILNKQTFSPDDEPRSTSSFASSLIQEIKSINKQKIEGRFQYYLVFVCIRNAIIKENQKKIILRRTALMVNIRGGFYENTITQKLCFLSWLLRVLKLFLFGLAAFLETKMKK